MSNLSIIILNYNTFDLTCQCIRSIYSSNKSITDMEIIVVDNGSTETIPQQFDMLFPAVKLIKTGTNLGFAKGNNIGLNHATKDYVLLLNSDVIIDVDDTLYKCINKLESMPVKVVLSTSLRSPNGDYQVAYGPLPSIGDELIFATFLYKLFPSRLKKKKLFVFDDKQEVHFESGYLVATFYLFERSLLNKLADNCLYDQTFLYGEELFWAYNWKKVGVRSLYYPVEQVRHLVGQSSLTHKTYTLKLRKAYQLWGEYRFVRYRYSLLLCVIFYMVRVIRLFFFSWNRDMRLKFLLTIDMIRGKLKQKYPLVR